MENKIKCSKCSSENVIKWCKRKTQNRGFVQRYYCKDCNKYFSLNDGFYRMRNSPQKITLCLDLFYRGVSTRKVQEHLQAFYPHNSSHKSIYKWILKYSKLISKFTNSLKLNVGQEVQVDEVEYHRRKSHTQKRGIEVNWFIDSVCPKTKFLVASNYYKNRSQKEVKEIIKAIKNKTENQIKVITTDGWLAYGKSIRSVYTYNNKTATYGVEHNKTNASKGEGFNHPIERLHNSLRARTKTMRGFHGSISSANAILKGYEIYYNFITKHQTINCCPYELAIPELKDKLNVPNKWLTLIELSNKDI